MYLNGLDVVVTNYRTPKDLAGFCRSLADFPPQREWTLTVVNVSPRDADIVAGDQIVDELGANHLLFEDNVGYGRACNAGALKGEFRHLGLFNADVVLTPYALEQCCQALDDNPDWAVLGPRQVDDRGLLTHAGIFGTEDNPKHRAWYQSNHALYGDVVPAVTVSGAAYFIRRENWDLLTECPKFRDVAPDAEGAFLPTPLYFEETWCSYHTRAHGSKVVYYGPVCIVHKWHRAVIEHGLESWAARQWRPAQEMFRRACDHHGIPHD